MARQKPIIVVLASQKGGVGKSSLSRALAVMTARAGLQVTIADLDPQQATVVEWMKTRLDGKVARKIVVDAFDSVEDALFETGNCDLLVVDTPARANRETLNAARQAHLLVQPSAGSLDDLKPAVLLFHEFKKAGIPVVRLAIALTRILSRNEEIAARAFVENAGYMVLPGSIREHAAYRDAQNTGRALNETADNRLNEEADALLTELMSAALASAKSTVSGGAAPRKERGGAA